MKIKVYGKKDEYNSSDFKESVKKSMRKASLTKAIGAKWTNVSEKEAQKLANKKNKKGPGGIIYRSKK